MYLQGFSIDGPTARASPVHHQGEHLEVHEAERGLREKALD